MNHRRRCAALALALAGILTTFACVAPDDDGAGEAAMESGNVDAALERLQASAPEAGWTITTRDGSLSAHWEHTVAITADGPRILTTA